MRAEDGKTERMHPPTSKTQRMYTSISLRQAAGHIDTQILSQLVTLPLDIVNKVDCGWPVSALSSPMLYGAIPGGELREGYLTYWAEGCEMFTSPSSWYAL